jgi:fructose-specific phosphotransferase system IIC component
LKTFSYFYLKEAVIIIRGLFGDDKWIDAMDFRTISRWFIIAGVGLLAVGIIFWLIGKVLPREIPGTLRFQVGNVTVSFPILLSIILSVVLTVVLNLIARFLNR